MPYFKQHVFICQNERGADAPRPSCARQGGMALFDYAKRRIRELELSGKGEIRINKAGCLDRCELGPVMVVYPDEVWYTCFDESDVEEIIQSHLIGGQPVERLRLQDADA